MTYTMYRNFNDYAFNQMMDAFNKVRTATSYKEIEKQSKRCKKWSDLYYKLIIVDCH